MKEMQKTVLAIVLLAALVGTASAWQVDFQNIDYDELWTYIEKTQGTVELTTDTRVYDATDDQTTGLHVGGAEYPDPQFITQTPQEWSYFAYTITSYMYNDGRMVSYFYDSNKNLIAARSLGVTSLPSRVEFVRDGTEIRCYANGVEGASLSDITSSIYYVGFGSYRYWSNTRAWIDDLVYNSDRVVVSTIPYSWYIRQDIMNPVFNGVYDYNDDQKATDMQITYSSDSSCSKTIKIVYQPTETIIYQTTVSGHTGSHLLDTTAVFNGTQPSGMYYVKLYEGEVLQDYYPFYVINTGGTLSFDKEEYTLGEEATVTWEISDSYWDTDSYDYSIKIYDINGNLADSQAVTAQSGSYEIDLEGWDTTDYFGALVFTEDGSSTDNWMAMDTMAVAGYVTLRGTTYDAAAGTVLEEVGVNIQCFDTWYNTTSAAVTGAYTSDPIEAGSDVFINATKANYTHAGDHTLYLSADTSDHDIYMLPDAALWNGTTAIRGIVWDTNEHQAIDGATVNIWNDTWSDTATSSSTGYYAFTDLAANETYSVNASATSYHDSADYEVTTIADAVATQNLALTGDYLLTVYLKNYYTNALITDSVTVTSSDGTSATTSNGTAYLHQDYGIVTITATAENYYETSSNVYINDLDGEELTLYLHPYSGESNVDVQYTPHEVRIRIVDIYGRPIPDVTITATATSSTLSDWQSWLYNLFGIDEEVVNVTDSMAGDTGTDGSIVFVMIPTFKYTMTFEHDDYDIDTMNFYPRDSEYLITVFPSEGASTSEDIDFLLYAEIVDTTTRNLVLEYDDSLEGTESLYFYVKERAQYENGTYYYNTIYDNTYSDQDTVDAEHEVTGSAGSVYIYGFNATHADFDNPITESNLCRIEGRLVAVADPDIPDTFYNWMTITLTILVGGLFSRYNVRDGVATLPFWTSFLKFIGWFPIMPWLPLQAALVLGILYYVRAGWELIRR